MGELNFVHAKRPKYMKKNQSFREQDADQIKEKGGEADNEIDSVEIQSKNYSVRSKSFVSRRGRADNANQENEEEEQPM